MVLCVLVCVDVDVDICTRKSKGARVLKFLNACKCVFERERAGVFACAHACV